MFEGVVITIAWPCLLNGRLFGIAGLEVYMNDVLEHVTHYKEDSSYAFVIDKRGLSIMGFVTLPAYSHV